MVKKYIRNPEIDNLDVIDQEFDEDEDRESWNDEIYND